LADRIVVDRTGLSGPYDWDLEWLPEETLPASVSPDRDSPEPGVSLFVALQEQLGLKLEATKAPVDVIVVDGAAPPTPD
jgi:uncharacterized protein (TIGR03435 family)